MSLTLLFPVFLAIAMPLFPPDNPVTMIWGPFAMIWRENMVVSLAGIFSALIVTELKRGFFTWTIPGIDRFLVRGFVILALTLTLPIAFTGATLFGLKFGIVFLGAGVLFFAVGTELMEFGRSKWYRGALAAIVAFLLWRPEYIHQVALTSPVLFGTVTAVLALLIFRRAASADSARVRPFLSDPAIGIVGGEALQQLWATKTVKRGDWNNPLFNGSVFDWVSAGYYETFSSRSGTWVRYAATLVAWGAIWSWAVGNPSFMMLIAGQTVIFGGLQLRTGFIYPLARDQRRNVFYASCLLENAFISVLSAILLWGLFTFGPGSITAFIGYREKENISGLVAVGHAALLFMLLPIAQWAKIKGPLNPRAGVSQSRKMLKAWGFAMLFAVVAMAVTFTLFPRRSTVPAAWLLVLAMTLMIQALFWFAIQRHFRRADIVLQSGS
ncbi:MAG: hypothetical protein H0U64_09500 [Gemmatimonadaceae bacterium]|nr:hypothetical protein [Gemmatimonadaceae bacterium]